MSTPQTDAFWDGQQRIIQNFYQLLEDDDVVEAEQELDAMEDDDEVHYETVHACRIALEEHYQKVAFWEKEELINLTTKHE